MNVDVYIEPTDWFESLVYFHSRLVHAQHERLNQIEV